MGTVKDKTNATTDADVQEIRFHGRGGQGAVSAAALLALAAYEKGYQAQAFPKFGSERRGAPVEAYVRISNQPIRAHNQVYTPNIVVIQDSTLLKSEPVLQGLKANGLIVLNSAHQPSQPEEIENEYRWICLPASQIAETHLGRPLPNTVLLGALAAVTDWDILPGLAQAIENHLAKKGKRITEKNIEALHRGYESALQQGRADSRKEIAP